ncbi:nitroreductase [Agaricicola taiwanensis]|uniref:Putative NAD(P)H nitroreductase n=2 Tax=Agaricicola taiwanensis TaxID=591372 RepID=A0A8J3DYU6_9RHOB|nr:nitroreductase [Agaricicola taiwanensis]
MRAPGPDQTQLETLLTIASRVPDHGKLAPWRFIVASGEARKKLADALWEARKADFDPDDVARLTEERTKLSDAPTLVVVVSQAAPHEKIPEWEQVLSAGAVCLNLVTAALAMGYGASWLTGWSAYDERARETLGVADGEKVAGIIYIGTFDMAPTDRPRPALADIVTAWQGG